MTDNTTLSCFQSAPKKLVTNRKLFLSLPADKPTKLSSNVRRRRTANDAIQSNSIEQLTINSGLTTSGPMLTAASLQQKILDTIKERVEKSGMSSAGLNFQSLAWFLPQSTSYAQTSVDLLEDPLIVTEAEVRRVFQLKESTAYSSMPDSGQTFFYMRTFMFSVHELKEILQTMLDEGYEYFDKLYVWLAELEELDDDYLVFIRYIGQTQGRAFDRHYGDIVRITGSSFARRFIQIALDLHPDVLDSAVIQEFTSATIQFAADQKVRDERERVLIALFGNGTLNVEKGGSGLNWEPKAEDEDLLRKLKPVTASLITSKTKTCSQAMKNELKSLADDIQHMRTTIQQRLALTSTRSLMR